MSTEDQARALRVALQTLGDLCGFGFDYFELDKTGYLRTATKMSADSSALMRNIRRHEHALEGAIAGVCYAPMTVERGLGVELPDEGRVHVSFDDSIIAYTAAEKRQDIDEVAGELMQSWEHCAKWCGEDEATTRRGTAAAGGLVGSRDSGPEAKPRTGYRGAGADPTCARTHCIRPCPERRLWMRSAARGRQRSQRVHPPRRTDAVGGWTEPGATRWRSWLTRAAEHTQPERRAWP